MAANQHFISYQILIHDILRDNRITMTDALSKHNIQRFGLMSKASVSLETGGTKKVTGDSRAQVGSGVAPGSSKKDLSRLRQQTYSEQTTRH